MGIITSVSIQSQIGWWMWSVRSWTVCVRVLLDSRVRPNFWFFYIRLPILPITSWSRRFTFRRKKQKYIYILNRVLFSFVRYVEQQELTQVSSTFRKRWWIDTYETKAQWRRGEEQTDGWIKIKRSRKLIQWVRVDNSQGEWPIIGRLSWLPFREGAQFFLGKSQSSQVITKIVFEKK